MKQILLGLVIVAFTLAGCVQNKVDWSRVPQGIAHDLGCDIDVMESSINILDMTEENAVAYLLNAGWQEIEDSMSLNRLFICKDTALMVELDPYCELGPRTKLQLIVKDGKIKMTKLVSYCSPSEQPFHHLTKWEAWFLRKYPNFRHWRVSMHANDEHFHFDALPTDQHSLFYSTLDSISEEDISSMWISYADVISLTIDANKQQKFFKNSTEQTQLVHIDMVAILSDQHELSHKP